MSGEAGAAGKRLATVWLRIGAECCRGSYTVERDLRRLTGVVQASLDVRSGIAHVTYEPDLTDPPRLVEAMRRAGHVVGSPIGA